jgi:septal ring factor EnvC (AmiA/AmiB activator)
MRIVVLFISLIISLYASNIDKKISSTKKKLSSSEKESKTTHSKLDKLAKQLTNEIKKLDSISKQIVYLTNNLKNSEIDLKNKRDALDEREKIQKALVDKKKNLEIKLIDYLARDLSLSFVLKKTGNPDIKSIMQEEIFKKYSSLIKKDTKLLIREIADSKRVINKVESDIKKIANYIDTTNNKIKKLATLKSNKKKLIVSLEVRKKDYSKRLKSVLKQKKSLATILKKLRDTKQKEEREKEKRLSAKERIQRDNLAKKESDVDIRTIGSSYQRAKTTSYKGIKYNPPLKKYKVVKKFGPYVDPIYKIKIFNNSVVLKSKIKNQKVRSVLAGKVVFAKETPTLKKVVIIKHSNSIHTVYAHLDEIASVIKSGKYVPTGYVVGRISNELVFEVTKKDRYINPAQFLKLR